MTLEGEYYDMMEFVFNLNCRVAILMTLEGEYYSKAYIPPSNVMEVAILMTLEGEYYKMNYFSLRELPGRNPHDIGRRILPHNVIEAFLKKESQSS